ncbi:MAG: hypothetical protein RMN24_00755, partial [Anaerolineae bacterium]|nr:hypothetical protein [Anaerolineae bacterium]
ERVVTDTSTVAWDLTTAGQARANVVAGSIGASQLATSFKTRTLNFIIDGGGAVITTGSKGYVVVDFAATAVSWTILAAQSGSIVVDVRRATYATFPTTSSIAGTEKPTLTSAQKNQDTSLTTWSTIAAGDILEFVVESVATVTRVTVSIRLEQTA